jgi:hypothetical protein
MEFTGNPKICAGAVVRRGQNDAIAGHLQHVLVARFPFVERRSKKNPRRYIRTGKTRPYLYKSIKEPRSTTGQSARLPEKEKDVKKFAVRLLLVVALLAAFGSTPVLADGTSPPSCKPPLVCMAR